MKLKTREDVLKELERVGMTPASWARKHGFPQPTVANVINGKSPCRSGTTHKIAVMLGMKDGEIVEG